MIVCKFGGTSVAEIDNATKIKEICQNKNRKIIVVSALGKSKDCKYKVTDKLFGLYNKILSKENFDLDLNEIFLRYKEVSAKLGVMVNWDKENIKLREYIEIGCITKEFIVSRGEYYSALLYAKYLKAKFIDAKDYIIFKKNKEIDYKNTKKRLKCLKKHKKCVIGGFYGANTNGDICLFDRGGSDISGAIISKCLNAEIYENYTDVDGVYNKNPNIFDGAKNMPLLNFSMAIRMADNGNEIVHKRALEEIKNSACVLNVKSTNSWKKMGTIIVDCHLGLNDLMVCKTDCHIATFSKLNKDDISKMANYIDVYKVAKINSCYFVYFKSLYVPEDKFKKLFNCLENKDYTIFTFFQNCLINAKNIKVIEKIIKKTKKIKKYSLFLSYLNNFQIICEKNKQEEIIKIINKVFTRSNMK